MLLTISNLIGNKSWGTLANTSKKNQDAPGDISGKNVGRDIKNLLSILKSAKSEKPFSKTDFLIFRAKKPLFIYKKLLPMLRFLGILI